MNIFLLRGLVREKGHWFDYIDYVKEAFPNANIIGLDFLGVGEKYKITTPPSFKEMVEEMRAENIQYFDGQQDNMIISISLGGMIVRQWLELYPDDFSKVVLMNSSFKGLSPIYRRLQPKSMVNFLKLFASAHNLEKVERGILEMVSNDRTHHDEVHKKWVEITTQRPVSRMSFVNQIRAALTFDPPLSKPKAELLILAGKDDRLCHYSCSEKIHEAWGGELHIKDDCGHDMPLDAPVWSIGKIKNWVEKTN